MESGNEEVVPLIAGVDDLRPAAQAPEVFSQLPLATIDRKVGKMAVAVSL
nr:MAG TPA: hypothetical protein [Caudoviricetes sp.]